MFICMYLYMYVHIKLYMTRQWLSTHMHILQHTQTYIHECIHNTLLTADHRHNRRVFICMHSSLEYSRLYICCVLHFSNPLWRPIVETELDFCITNDIASVTVRLSIRSYVSITHMKLKIETKQRRNENRIQFFFFSSSVTLQQFFLSARHGSTSVCTALS